MVLDQAEDAKRIKTLKQPDLFIIATLEFFNNQ